MLELLNKDLVLSKYDFGKEFKSGNEAMHVALTGTENYIPWIGVTMTSILEHNKEEKFCFHLLLDSLGDKENSNLSKFSRQWNVPVHVYVMNDESISKFGKFTRYIIDGKFVGAFIYRFFIPCVLDTNIKKVLYIDGDIVCNGKLSDLFEMDLMGNSVAVSEDIQGEIYAKNFNLKKYFNSGVLLIDTCNWNRKILTIKLLKGLEKALNTKIDLPCPDQDILNIVLENETLFVSQKYNLPYRLVRPSVFKAKIVNGDAEHASLIHFIGAIKPWTSYNQSVPIVKVWAHAKANSPWKDVSLHEPDSQKAIHQAAREARSQGRYGKMLIWYLKFIKSKIDGTRKVGY